MKKKLPYSERSDVDKVRANWTKTRGLFERDEYSVAIIRAATTVEIAVNLAVRQELISAKGLPMKFVDQLLKWTNGVNGKLNNMLKPLWQETPQGKERFKTLSDPIRKVNLVRNSVVHSGEFKNRRTAIEVLDRSHLVIMASITPYEPKFVLKRIV
jgi:hypothetical protein